MTELEEIRFRLEELERRQAQMVVRGVITEVDPVKAVAKVRYGDNQTTGWLMWKPDRTGDDVTWWCPTVGEGVTVVSNGDASQGEILTGSYYKEIPAPSTDPELHLTRYADGTEFSYNKREHELKIDVSGGPVILTTGAGVKITGDVAISGTLQVTGGITAKSDIADSVRSMSADREIFNGHKHTGNMGSPTTPPLQKQDE